jgi:hypothetical protein
MTGSRSALIIGGNAPASCLSKQTQTIVLVIPGDTSASTEQALGGPLWSGSRRTVPAAFSINGAGENSGSCP